MLIYVAGPISTGDIGANFRDAAIVGHLLMDRGHTVCVPHLSHFLHMIRSRSADEWLKQRLAQVSTCDAVFKLPGGLQDCFEELKLADKLNKAIYRSLDDVPNDATNGGRT